MLFFYHLHQKVEKGIGGAFERYGRLMARHPFKIVVIIGVIDIGLGLGLLRINTESGIDQYVPTGSTASKDQDSVCTSRYRCKSNNFLPCVILI